jgi:hypothetical protein
MTTAKKIKTTMYKSIMKLAPLTLLLLGGCALDAGETDSGKNGTDEIINGTETNARPGVGKIMISETAGVESPSTLYCTGTLVGKHTVLTAAHCAAAHPTWPRIFSMNMPDKSIQTVKVTKMQIAPGYVQRESTSVLSLFQSDVAVFDLAMDVNVKATPVSAATPKRASAAILTGYGRTALNEIGGRKKRETKTIIDDVLDFHIVFRSTDKNPGLSCSGDSGGPALATRRYTTDAGKQVQGEVITGVTSFGDCRATSHYARTDILVKWLQTASGGDVVVVK